MLWYSSHTSYMQNIRYVESLSTCIIIDVPYFYHSLGVTCYKGIQIARAINSYNRRVVTIKFYDVLFTIRIPNEYFKIKSTTYENFMPLTICKLSYCSIMTFQYLRRFLDKLVLMAIIGSWELKLELISHTARSL
jgi:hypothetical protein